MHPVTAAIREQYERYPYPPGGEYIRLSTDARLLLSFVERRRSRQGPIRVLDAGCGRGMGVISCAYLQPDVEFLGVDINRVGLSEAEAYVRRNGLANVRFQEVDLMTLDGLDIPPGGFDVIYSSGVLHHLPDPLEGLRKLESVLAPHGVIHVMVYGARAREALYRFIRAVRLLAPPERPLPERIAAGRAAAKVFRDGVLQGTRWEVADRVDDVEFVDMCLNAHETAFDVKSFFALAESAGLRFIRWSQPEKWSVEGVIPEGPLRVRVRQLDPTDQYAFIEEMEDRPALECVLAKAGNAPRRPFEAEQAERTVFAVNPDANFAVWTRNVPGEQRIERVEYRVRAQDWLTAEPGPFAEIMLMLNGQNLPFTGDSLLKHLAAAGANEMETRNIVKRLVDEEVVFRPHLNDVIGLLSGRGDDGANT